MRSEDDFQRIKIKQLADEVRFHWLKLGFTDVFEILNEIAIVIRSPHETSEGKKFSGFSSYIRKNFVVYINSSYTLGHERFTAAHELYHLLFDKEILMNKKLLSPNNKDMNERNANIFATEFLMPEEGVYDFCHKKINGNLEPKHIIWLQNNFQVSYRAMLKRLLELEICDKSVFDELVKYCSNDPKYIKMIKELTIKEGYTTNLIEPSYIYSIPQPYIQTIIDNYEDNKISYGKFSSLLKLINKTPEDYGFSAPNDEVF